jgi:hypothetical protein
MASLAGEAGELTAEFYAYFANLSRKISWHGWLTIALDAMRRQGSLFAKGEVADLRGGRPLLPQAALREPIAGE